MAAFRTKLGAGFKLGAAAAAFGFGPQRFAAFRTEFRSLRAGAAGYLLKDAATGELELALRSVMRGESWLSPAVSRQVVEGYVHRTGGDAAPEVLTARQREVLRLVAGGKSTKEIAFLLNLSVKTVETHRAQIMDRLGIRDVAGLVRYALRTGLVPPDG